MDVGPFEPVSVLIKFEHPVVRSVLVMVKDVTVEQVEGFVLIAAEALHECLHWLSITHENVFVVDLDVLENKTTA